MKRMSPFILLNTADISIGLIDKASNSHEALMEFVIQEITSKEVVRGDEVVPSGIAEWYGVTIEDDKLTQIHWHRRRIHGSVHLEWLPFTVRIFVAYSNQLTGTIDLSHLPNVMECLNLSDNELVGPIDLENLPGELKILHLDRNRLNGSVELTRLPGKLQSLMLWRNQFSGSLNLTNLPPDMAKLCLQTNFFSGTVDLRLLPSGMKRLTLSDNELSGEVFIDSALFNKVHVGRATLIKRILEVASLDPKHVPRCWQTSLMDQFYASISEDGKIELSKGNPSHDYCEWRGVACDAGLVRRIKYMHKKCGNFDIHSLSPTVKQLEIEHSQQTYTLQTRAFPRDLQICALGHNELFGPVDLQTLPANLRRMYLWDNKLTGPMALTGLPRKLEYLNIEANRIVQSVVYYDGLPPKVKEIRLVKRAEGTNRIGKVCAVHADRAVKNKEIFKHMPRKQVR